MKTGSPEIVDFFKLKKKKKKKKKGTYRIIVINTPNRN